MNRLDRGVFNVNLHDGRRWIVRVFPARRPIELVTGDAAILRLLEKHGFPAERCIDADPVSVLYGRGILVTGYIEGTCADSDEHTLHAFGAMLGQLNTLPVEGDALAAREAGALHHYALQGGGPAN